mmetsp:Transcript_1940/g.4230  ORF Transcript_1940/g.4230 Transcript_1940/m.4230 type:complete len:204 (+) Transcript_1940:214-825(+)
MARFMATTALGDHPPFPVGSAHGKSFAAQAPAAYALCTSVGVAAPGSMSTLSPNSSVAHRTRFVSHMGDMSTDAPACTHSDAAVLVKIPPAHSTTWSFCVCSSGYSSLSICAKMAIACGACGYVAIAISTDLQPANKAASMRFAASMGCRLEHSCGMRKNGMIDDVQARCAYGDRTGSTSPSNGQTSSAERRLCRTNSSSSSS